MIAGISFFRLFSILLPTPTTTLYMTNQAVPVSDRILSIDILRGFDMLMILGMDRLFARLHDASGSSFTAALAHQFDHPEWFGSTFYDIIMPLFLFVVGAVIPFSLQHQLQKQQPLSKIYGKLIRRVLMLFFLGWIVQGNLLALDWGKFHIFSNTLQAIAVGYFFASLAYLHLSQRARYLLFGGCLLLYAVLLVVPMVPGVGRSVLLPDQNFAIYLDRLILGGLDDGTQYTWLLSGLGFLATTLSGMFAGELIQSDLPREKVAQRLLLWGIAALAIGLLWGIWHPIVKKIWSSSFVLASSGVCLLLLSLFYWIIDVKGWSKWAFPLKVIGMNAIAAYVLSHVLPFHTIAGFVLFGLQPYVGTYYEALTVLGGMGLLYWLLWYLYRNETFIKV
jgi:predicted acyltransferase